MIHGLTAEIGVRVQKGNISKNKYSYIQVALNVEPFPTSETSGIFRRSSRNAFLSLTYKEKITKNATKINDKMYRWE